MTEGRFVIPPGEGETVWLGGLGVVRKISGGETGGQFAVVEHPLRPGALAGPPHTHANEDEISFVLEGEVTVQIGEEVVRAGAGAYVVKPRGVPHTFWNAGTTPARLIEIISPAGFEAYFGEMAEILAGAGAGPPDAARMAEVAERYGLTLHPERLPALMERYGVRLG